MKAEVPGVMTINTETAQVQTLSEAAYNRLLEIADGGTPETPVSKIKPTPRIGETLVILHEIKRDSRNEAILGFQRRAKPIHTRIVAVYLDGSVRDNHSDVWEVKPGKLGQWETVNPEREQAIKAGKI